MVRINIKGIKLIFIRTIHLGKNPRSGGNPAKERRLM